MSKFRTIFLMQIKEKLDLSFLKSKKQTMFKVAFSILGFVAVTAFAYLILYLCQKLNLFSALNHIPVSFMAFVFFVIFVLNIFTCTLGLSKSLYYSKDNQVLLTFPINPNTLFLSKLLVYYIYEIKKTFTLLVPIFFAYGLLSGFSLLYFVWAAIMLTIVASIPVLLGGLLSIPTNFVLAFLKKFPLVKILLAILVLGGLVTGVVFLINLIPENINLIKTWTYVAMWIRDFLNTFTNVLYPFYAFGIFLCGKYIAMNAVLFTEYSWIVLLSMLGIIVVLVGLNLLLSRPFYLKLVTRQFEFNKKENGKEKPNSVKNIFWSSCVYEAKRNFRDTGVLTVSIATLVIAPIAVLFLNTIYAAINTRLLGDYFTISFNVLVIMLFVLAHNINVSSIFSRDGEALYLNKVKPSKPFQVLLPRLFYNIIFSLLILIASSSIFFSFSTLSGTDAMLLFFAMFFTLLAHIFWSAEIDFLHPQARLFQTEGAATNNPNELKSTILTFAISFLFFGVTIFLLIDAMPFVWLKIFIISLLLLALRVWLFLSKAKTLFKEI